MGQQTFAVLNAELLPVIRELTASGNDVFLPVHGRSMRPFIPTKSALVHLTKWDGIVKNGDILLVETDVHGFLLHRVIRWDKTRIWLNGDAQLAWEGPFDHSRILAVAVSVEHAGAVKPLRRGTLYWLGLLWMRMYPVRPLIMWLVHDVYRPVVHQLMRLRVKCRGDA